MCSKVINGGAEAKGRREGVKVMEVPLGHSAACVTRRRPLTKGDSSNGTGPGQVHQKKKKKKKHDELHRGGGDLQKNDQVEDR